MDFSFGCQSLFFICQKKKSKLALHLSSLSFPSYTLGQRLQLISSTYSTIRIGLLDFERRVQQLIASVAGHHWHDQASKIGQQNVSDSCPAHRCTSFLSCVCKRIPARFCQGSGCCGFLNSGELYNFWLPKNINQSEKNIYILLLFFGVEAIPQLLG